MSVSTTLAIEGMTCGGCARSVKAALQTIRGVTSVTADHEAAAATVESGSELDRDAVRAVLQEAGFGLK